MEIGALQGQHESPGDAPPRSQISYQLPLGRGSACRRMHGVTDLPSAGLPMDTGKLAARSTRVGRLTLDDLGVLLTGSVELRGDDLT